MTMALFLALSCSKPIMQNASKFPWNDYDKSILHQAQNRCGELYPEAPCVRLFRKFNKNQYTVICGKKK